MCLAEYFNRKLDLDSRKVDFIEFEQIELSTSDVQNFQKKKGFKIKHAIFKNVCDNF